ncbi:hypothetical protein RND81_04G122800 [Saponaria officinalis]|uniref:Uncharacterized protein n=1 Tax=Saponaria officinalis TaxID=3572 RepID=A0AAW1LED2_SAPOF
MHGDLDDKIFGLRSQVRQLKYVAHEIQSEAKYQKEFMNQLLCADIFSFDYVIQQMTLIKAQASLKNMRRLNRSMVRSGSNHIMHVVLFALFCCFLVYIWSKFSRR